MKRRAVWKTVPHDKLIANIMNYIAPSPYGSVRTRSKRSRITPMRRILSFTDLIISCVTTWYWIYYGLHLRLYGAGCLQQEIIRGNPSARQAQINPTTQKKSVKEQIRRIGFIRDCLWTWRASQRRASTSMGYCLPDSITSISFSNPETSSRVTLATLGIVFQTKLVVAHQGKA